MTDEAQQDHAGPHPKAQTADNQYGLDVAANWQGGNFIADAASCSIVHLDLHPDT